MTKKQKKAIDRRVEKAFYDTCSGVQISVLDIGKVFDAGRVAVADGADDDALRAAVVEFVNTVRKN